MCCIEYFKYIFVPINEKKTMQIASDKFAFSLKYKLCSTQGFGAVYFNSYIALSEKCSNISCTGIVQSSDGDANSAVFSWNYGI